MRKGSHVHEQALETLIGMSPAERLGTGPLKNGLLITAN